MSDGINHNEMEDLLTYLNVTIEKRNGGDWIVLCPPFDDTDWKMTARQLRRLIIRYMNTLYDPDTEDGL